MPGSCDGAVRADESRVVAPLETEHCAAVQNELPMAAEGPQRRPGPVWWPLNEGRAGPGVVLQESLECIDASRVDGGEEGLRERGIVGEAEHGADLG